MAPSPSMIQNTVSRPVARKRIEPVIPLPYLQRRPKQPPASSAQVPSPLRTNSEDTPPNSGKPHARPRTDEAQDMANGVKPPAAASPAAPPQKVEQEETAILKVEADRRHQEPGPAPVAPATQGIFVHQPMAGEVTPPDDPPSAPSPTSFAPPAMSSITHDHMHPPFYPVNNHPAPVHFRGPIPEPIRMPQHALNGPRMHQQHPSNGSMIFGGFRGSNTSSPAPHSGGTFPPPMPMAHEQMPVAAVDAFGRPIMSAGPIDGPASVAMNHGPMTPHSFHGSHSSWNPEDNHVTKPLVNGHSGVDVGRLGPPPGVARAQQPPHSQPPFNPDVEVGDAMGFTEQISSMFARPDFADCELCLVLPDKLTSVNSQHPATPNHPLRLPAHGLILSTNRVLRNIMREQAGQPGGLREIHVGSEDAFLRADAMWRAVKHVYGCRYVPLPMGLQREADVEKFHFALGYAAAGALLEEPRISITAMMEASGLLSWDTVEKGLEFVLRESVIVPNRMDGPQTPLFPHFRYKHGIYVNELVEKIMMFIITNFPSNFTLDTTVDEPRYSRFPVSPSKSADGVSTTNASVGQASSRLASINIRFGDMDLSENNGRGQSTEQQQSAGYRAALSRILLNLPFEMVKFLLESNSVGGVSGWQTAQDRRRMIPSVILQREARRKDFISRLKWDRWQQDRAPTEGLTSEDPQLFGDGWNSVCWEEQCMPNTDMIVMDRRWKPVSKAS